MLLRRIKIGILLICIILLLNNAIQLINEGEIFLIVVSAIIIFALKNNSYSISGIKLLPETLKQLLIALKNTVSG